jgi:hypothetical protein
VKEGIEEEKRCNGCPSALAIAIKLPLDLRKI